MVWKKRKFKRYESLWIVTMEEVWREERNEHQKKKKRWRRREGGQGAIWISKNVHSSLITHYSITHHLSLKISQLPKMACLALVSNFDNKKILLFVGPICWLSASFTSYFLFLFFLQPPIPKLTEPSEKE